MAYSFQLFLFLLKSLISRIFIVDASWFSLFWNLISEKVMVRVIICCAWNTSTICWYCIIQCNGIKVAITKHSHKIINYHACFKAASAVILFSWSTFNKRETRSLADSVIFDQSSDGNFNSNAFKFALLTPKLIMSWSSSMKGGYPHRLDRIHTQNWSKSIRGFLWSVIRTGYIRPLPNSTSLQLCHSRHQSEPLEQCMNLICTTSKFKLDGPFEKSPETTTITNCSNGRHSKPLI